MLSVSSDGAPSVVPPMMTTSRSGIAKLVRYTLWQDYTREHLGQKRWTTWKLITSWLVKLIKLTGNFTVSSGKAFVTCTLIDGTLDAITGIHAFVSLFKSRAGGTLFLVFAIAEGMVFVMLVVNEKAVHICIPDDRVTSLAFRFVKEGIVGENRPSTTWKLPPHAHLILDGVHPEEPCVAEFVVVFLGQSDVVVVVWHEMPQFPDRDHASEWCSFVVRSHASPGCSYEVLFFPCLSAERKCRVCLSDDCQESTEPLPPSEIVASKPEFALFPIVTISI